MPCSAPGVGARPCATRAPQPVAGDDRPQRGLPPARSAAPRPDRLDRATRGCGGRAGGRHGRARRPARGAGAAQRTRARAAGDALRRGPDPGGDRAPSSASPKARSRCACTARATSCAAPTCCSSTRGACTCGRGRGGNFGPLYNDAGGPLGDHWVDEDGTSADRRLRRRRLLDGVRQPAARRLRARPDRSGAAAGLLPALGQRRRRPLHRPLLPRLLGRPLRGQPHLPLPPRAGARATCAATCSPRT